MSYGGYGGQRESVDLWDSMRVPGGQWGHGGLWGIWGAQWSYGEDWGLGGHGELCGSTGGTRGHEGLRQTWEGVKGDPGEWGTRVTRQGGTGT